MTPLHPALRMLGMAGVAALALPYVSVLRRSYAVFYSMHHLHIGDPRALAHPLGEVGAMLSISALFALSLVFVRPHKAAASAFACAALLLLPVVYVVWSAFQVLG